MGKDFVGMDQYKQLIDKVWKRADENMDGYVDAFELHMLVTEVSKTMNEKPPPQSSVYAMLKRYDVDSDGRLNRREFGLLVEELFKDVLVLGRHPGGTTSQTS